MKVILLPKIHKRLSNIAERQFISTCELLNEKVFAFLENQRKSVKMSESYINDSKYFLEKIKSINPLPENAILHFPDYQLQLLE